MRGSEALEAAQAGMAALARALGRGFALWALFWAALFTAVLASAFGGLSPTWRAVLGVLAAVCAWAGIAALRRSQAAAAAARERAWVRGVLGLARREGVVREARLVATQGWTLSEARAALRHCSRAGLVEAEADEQGGIFWRPSPAGSVTAPLPPLPGALPPRRHSERRPPIADR